MTLAYDLRLEQPNDEREYGGREAVNATGHDLDLLILVLAYQFASSILRNAMTQEHDWFERIWQHREETLYPALFGAHFEGIFTIPAQRLEAGGLSDPRWLTCGVFRFAPTSQRPSWLYVSSGLSNEWFEEKPNPDGVSGFGCEFVMETSTAADWPIQRLHQLMVYQIGLCAGRYPGHHPLTSGYRVPLGSAIDFGASRLTFCLLVAPRGFPAELRQDSGVAEFIEIVGISESEKELARQNGNPALLAWLERNTCFPITDPARDPMLMQA